MRALGLMYHCSTNDVEYPVA